LFKLFINDLPKILDEKSESVNLDGTKMSCLLYADDLVLISDSKDNLQKKLDILYRYCQDWCVEINTIKNKNNYF
jgi:hypothetical protein